MFDLFTNRLADRWWDQPGGASSLTALSSNAAFNRPQLPWLVQVLQDGFRALDRRDLGELLALEAAGGLDWQAGFPFVGPAPGVWETVANWPSSAKSAWAPATGPTYGPPPRVQFPVGAQIRSDSKEFAGLARSSTPVGT